MMKMTRKIKLTDKSKVFFTSDIHFFHTNIIRYCKRPFKTAEEMNEVLVSNWNEKIPQDAEVFVVGDVSFGKLEETVKIIRRLNGRKHLVIGNHDEHFLQQPSFRACFETIADILQLVVEDDETSSGKMDLFLCHYAMRVWNKSHHGSINIYGHSHSTLPPNDFQLDVGVDGNNFEPYSYDDVLVKVWDNLFVDGKISGVRGNLIQFLDKLKASLVQW